VSDVIATGTDTTDRGMTTETTETTENEIASETGIVAELEKERTGTAQPVDMEEMTRRG